MHLADAFIQSDLQCIQVTVLHFISSFHLNTQTHPYENEFMMCVCVCVSVYVWLSFLDFFKNLIALTLRLASGVYP